MATRHWVTTHALAAAMLTSCSAGAGEPALAEALHQAATHGDARQVTALLERGAPLEARDGEGRTPLLAAVRQRRADTARVLILAGADVNAKDRILDSAYLLAGASGQREILELTLQHGADLRSTNRYGGTALIPAAERGHVEVVRTLIQAGVDVDHVNRLDWTALLEAIILGDGGPDHVAIVKLLIDAGADVNLADGNGITPLQHARQRGQAENIRLLLAANAR
jgi:ankyrin repeat protein